MNSALIGASTIASQYMINAFRSQPGGVVNWVVSATAKRTADYAARHEIPNFSTDINRVLAEPAVDAVYISSTNEKHFEQAMAAIARASMCCAKSRWR